MNVQKELKRFQQDRLLNLQEFDLRIATMNILEELMEAHGIGDNKERKVVSTLYTIIQNIILFTKKDIEDNEFLDGITFNEPTIEDKVDAFCDIQVFADGEVGKMGYDNEKCMLEVAKEINSRTGEIIDGKFTKFKTDEAMDLWYKANFSLCKEER